MAQMKAYSIPMKNWALIQNGFNFVIDPKKVVCEEASNSKLPITLCRISMVFNDMQIPPSGVET